MVKLKTVDDAIAYIHGRHKWLKTASFSRIERLLAELGHPELENQYIHVTGTNGKGSTSKMMAQILRTAGLRVGMFTSPFIERFNERIQDNAGMISDQALLEAVQIVAPITERLDQELPEGGPTEFETLTAVMFVYFQRQAQDVVILEVGIGGTWDTTEVIPDKLAAVITGVGLDHMKVLGDTIAQIAEAKAGIIQANRPVIIGPLSADADTVIRTHAQQLSAPVLAYGRDFKRVAPPQQQQFGERFDFSGLANITDIQLALTGEYQQVNASVALETVLAVAPQLGIEITDDIVRQALAQVTWPARFEKIADAPLTIIDGAHNLQGIQALQTTLTERFSQAHMHIMVGILNDKNFEAMLKMLSGIPNAKVCVVHFEAPHQRQDIDEHVVARLQKEMGISYAYDWQKQYAELKASEPDTPVIFTGSLYFVSEVRAAIKRIN